MSAIDVMKLDDDQWERYITSAESHPPTWLLASVAGINRNHPGVDRVLVFPPLKFLNKEREKEKVHEAKVIIAFLTRTTSLCEPLVAAVGGCGKHHLQGRCSGGGLY
ncbi:hypothetical protein C0Q70_20707 [Pomacea canaliculata]|uniref:Uncharacterized protein n=1 Tax=Pomacea canaliculata TaxID=400727 RepID=A0A2T7NGB4_POMCA|nr:hypothetical protein C0Q70_20707 [Pomacea canaliculata]